MKRGLILLIILLFLVIVNAQETKEELRINVDSKLLGKDGIIVNLTNFLGRSIDYYLVNKPQFVKVTIDTDFKLARITPIIGKTGSEVVIITTNKSKEFSLNETTTISKDVREDFINNVEVSINLSYDPVINKALQESLKNLKLEKEDIYNTKVNFSGDALFINIDNRSALNLSFSKNGEDIILENITLNFQSEDADSENLFYERKGFNFIYFFKTNFLQMLIFILVIILIIMLVIIFSRKQKKEISKEDFKKSYANKITLMKRSCHENNADEVFTQFSNEMREFLAKMLDIKYQFTYDELVNELIIKKIEESVKKDLVKFAKAMLELRYRKRPNLREIKELIEKGISIIKRF